MNGPGVHADLSSTILAQKQLNLLLVVDIHLARSQNRLRSFVSECDAIVRQSLAVISHGMKSAHRNGFCGQMSAVWPTDLFDLLSDLIEASPMMPELGHNCC